MKPSFALVLLSIIISFSACCTKVECVFPTGVSIVFHGYEDSELDSLYITGYEKNTNNTTIGREEYIDSARTNRYDEPEENLKHYNLDADYDWVLRIGTDGETYRFHNYTFGEAKCNSCFIGSDKRPVISGFAVNGEYKNRATFDIYK